MELALGTSLTPRLILREYRAEGRVIALLRKQPRSSADLLPSAFLTPNRCYRSVMNRSTPSRLSRSRVMSGRTGLRFLLDPRRLELRRRRLGPLLHSRRVESHRSSDESVKASRELRLPSRHSSSPCNSWRRCVNWNFKHCCC